MRGKEMNDFIRLYEIAKYMLLIILAILSIREFSIEH